jgi:hypothetical protein
MLNPHSRPFQEGDEEQIVGLYNKITGRNRTVLQHQWEWLQSPIKKKAIWVIEDQNTHQIIGHHGLIPTSISYNGTPYLMGKTENTIIDPGLSGNGMYFLYEKKFFEESSLLFDMLATTSGSGVPGKIRRRLNYKPVGKYEIYFTTCKNKNLRYGIANILKTLSWSQPMVGVSKYVGGFLACLLAPLFHSKKGKGRDITCQRITNIDQHYQEIDAFWQKNKDKFGITIDRNSEFLSWRIFDNPNVNYYFLKASDAQGLLGYIILKVRNGAVKHGVIEDIVANNLDINIFLRLLSEAKHFFNQEGCAAIIFPTLEANKTLTDVLTKGGFVNSRIIYRLLNVLFHRKMPEQEEFLLNITQKDIDETIIFNPKNWYFTGLFFEGIN